MGDDAAAKGKTDAWGALEYLPGFGGHFCSEALPNALPKGQNNPQKVRLVSVLLPLQIGSF